MKTNNFLFLYPDLKPGGAAKLMVQMANILSRNQNFILLGSEGGNLSNTLDEEINQFSLHLKRTHNIITKFIAYINTIAHLYRIIKKNRINIVVNHHRYFAPALLILKTFLNFRTVFNAAATFRKLPFIKGRFFGDQIIAVSNAVKDHLVSSFQVDESSITVIYIGIESFEEKSESFKSQLKNDLGLYNKQIISCIGHFRELKRQDFLLRAWKAIVNEHPDWHLVLLGFGETEFLLKDYVAQNSLNDSVTILVDSFEPEEILNISKVFVLPSKREGLPLSILEAFSLGIPAIGTNTSGINEVIDEGSNGFLFEMDDVNKLAENMKILMSDNEKRLAFGQSAILSFNEKFSIIKYQNAILDFFSKNP